MLERQNALSEAQRRELKAMTEYSKAVSELQEGDGHDTFFGECGNETCRQLAEMTEDVSEPK